MATATETKPKVTEGPAYDYTVKMTCGGCSGAIERVLKKNIAAPNGYDVLLDEQRVTVYGPELPDFETVTEKISKTGKQVLAKKEFKAGEKLPDSGPKPDDA